MFGGQIGKDMMIRQGYVPKTCTLPIEYAGPLIWDCVNKGIDVCSGCNADRTVCKGRPKEEDGKVSDCS